MYKIFLVNNDQKSLRCSHIARRMQTSAEFYLEPDSRAPSLNFDIEQRCWFQRQQFFIFFIVKHHGQTRALNHYFHICNFSFIKCLYAFDRKYMYLNHIFEFF